MAEGRKQSSSTALTRRSALGAVGGALLPGVGAQAGALAAGLEPRSSVSTGETARDAAFWRAVASHYEVADEFLNLENGNWGLMARPVLAEYERQTERVNRLNSYYARREFGAEIASVRRRIAQTLGVSPEEIALTRGATEALQALIGGYNRLRPGDEVMYSDLDYTSMQYAMNWLRERRGAGVVTVALPEPASHQNVIDVYERGLKANPRVRLLLLTHLSHRTGLVVPVREIAAMARARGVDVIVDAAHSWGQMDFKAPDLGADFIGFNLHKWMGAPLGVGVLYIRRERLADIDRYMADEDAPPDSIGSRVHTGTSNFAAFLSVPAALDFHEQVGPANKAARLRRLRNLWVEPLRDRRELEILTPDDPRMHAGITAFRLTGRPGVADNIALSRTLLDGFGIFTVHRSGLASGACVRATPALYNSEAEVARLARALGQILAA